jgi:signal peptidase I
VRAGAILFVCFLLALPAIIVAAALTESALALVTALSFIAYYCFYVVQIVMAVVAAHNSDEGFRLGRFNRPPIYAVAIGLYILAPGAVVLDGAVVRSFKVASESMRPILVAGDHVYVNRLSIPARGDVVAYERAGTVFVHRLIGLGGDTVEGRDSVVFVNGKALARDNEGQITYRTRSVADRGVVEDHRAEKIRERLGDRIYEVLENDEDSPANDFEEVTVPEGHFFVLGDNRDNANDSRFWGTLPLTAVVGRVDSIWFSSGDEGVSWDRVGEQVR